MFRKVMLEKKRKKKKMKNKLFYLFINFIN